MSSRGAVLALVLSLAAAVVLAPGPAGATAPGAAPAVPPAPVVQTDRGPVQGAYGENGSAFLGIPYAAPPVGARRWRAPVRAAAWRTPLVATKPATPCPQVAFGSGALTGGEDCLQLDVYLPPGDISGRAVLLWFHGGAFVGGDAGEVDGSQLASATNMIVVTANYRLGVLGFLTEDSLGAENRSGTSGQYGFQDQQAALRWVQRNAKAFGGNPERITLAGSSSGGVSVCLHLVAPGSRGRFSGAIIQSGSCIANTGSAGLRDQQTAAAQGAKVAVAAGCGSPSTRAECLRALPFSALQAAATTAARWSPHVDTSVIPRQPTAVFTAGKQARVPVIVGWNAQEASTSVLAAGPPTTDAEYQSVLREQFAADAAAIAPAYPSAQFASPAAAYTALLTDRTFVCPSLRLAHLLEPHAPTYAYEFADPAAPPVVPIAGQAQGAAHGTEVQYLFRPPAAEAAGVPTLTGAQDALARFMQGAWSSFAASGNPDPLPLWPLPPLWPRVGDSSGNVLVLTPGAIRVSTTARRDHRCDLWWKL